MGGDGARDRTGLGTGATPVSYKHNFLGFFLFVFFFGGGGGGALGNMAYYFKETLEHNSLF